MLITLGYGDLPRIVVPAREVGFRADVKRLKFRTKEPKRIEFKERSRRMIFFIEVKHED